MSAKERALIAPSNRIPDLTLPAHPAGSPLRVRPPGRRSPLLLFVHGTDCAACTAFLRRLTSDVDALRDWDAYPLIVVPIGSGADSAAAETHALPRATDPGGRLSTAVAVEAPALVIADQWGEVHLRHRAGEGHRFPDVAEIVEWLRFLAIQCPECQAESF